MGIFIRNAETERKIREVAAREGLSLTSAVDVAIDDRLAKTAPVKRKPTYDELIAATEALHAKVGYVPGSLPPMTKQDWDDLNAIGYPEIDDA